jgi:hypothetical protein
VDAFNKAIFEFMDAHRIRRTRENFIDICFMGTPPEQLDAEEEAELPKEFRRGDPGDWEEFE